jgi:hypothetical protein
MAIYLTGGLCGAVSNILINLILNLTKNKKSIFINPVVFDQLFNTFIPISQTNDEAKIRKNCFDCSNQEIKTINLIIPILQFLSNFYIAHNQRDVSASYIDTAFVTILNCSLKGFFHFET